ncbi:MAG: hypothetical protein ACI95C_000732 [Pseudohongiellaceae bacterium]|jgi:uncharacterized protein
MLGRNRIFTRLSSPMSISNSPLTEKELDFLNKFLLDRFDDDAEDTIDLDEGVLDVSELDGFFTAIVSGPVMIPPSRWLPAVWGDFAPTWESEKIFQTVFSLLVRHMNAIADTMLEHLNDFEPLFLTRKNSDNSSLIVDEWCEGYIRGVALAQSQWDTAGAEIAALLDPIQAFTQAAKWRGHNLETPALEKLQQTISPSVRKIYAYWLSRRMDSLPSSSPTIREEPKIGRNDPCPCGSGKKYKRCCLH